MSVNRTTFPSLYRGLSESSMDSALAGAQAGYYTAAVLRTMTENDKIYASKLLAAAGSLPAPRFTWVNPWDEDGA